MQVVAAALRPEMVAVLGVLVATLAGFAMAIACYLAWARAERPQLRHCPVCAADAVRVAATDRASARAVRIELQCGQCGTWRRLVAPEAESRRHRRGVERQLRRIRNEAARLASHRAQGEKSSRDG
jgi:hypothetical protein